MIYDQSKSLVGAGNGGEQAANSLRLYPQQVNLPSLMLVRANLILD